MIVRSRVIKIGNSRGIRIPRAFLERAGINDEVEIKVDGNQAGDSVCAPSAPGVGNEVCRNGESW